MPTRWGVTVLVTFSALLGTCCLAHAVEEQTGNWSEVHEHIKARLHLKHRFVNSQSEVLVYLELCNTCPPESTFKIKFPFSTVSSLSFTVKDSDGNEIKTGPPIFCSTIGDPKPFELILPQDCTMRFCISQNGGGTYQDRALLYPVPGQGWYFKHGENRTYELSATLSFAQSEHFEDRHWTGELKLPPVRIPLPESGQNESVDATEKTKN